jgi:cytochrome d ubiquinol oxidase subunit II
VAGLVAIAGLFVVRGHDHGLTHSLLHGNAIPAVIVSLLAGGATLGLVYLRRFEAARYGGALAVAAIVAGWALSRWPEILPGLTVDRAAAGHDTLVWVLVAVLAGGAILFPSLALLFRLTLTGRLGGESDGEGEPDAAPVAELAGALPRVPYRVPLACLIAGVGLLNAADARWAHAIGVVCLIAFVASGFLAVVKTALVQGPG